MIQVTPQMKILVALEPADFRCGIDGLARVCRESLGCDPFEGTLFVFRNRRGTAIKLLCYDGQGYWLFQKRMSKGKFHWWPSSSGNSLTQTLAAHQLHVLFSAGNPNRTFAAPDWRPVGPTAQKMKNSS